MQATRQPGAPFCLGSECKRVVKGWREERFQVNVYPLGLLHRRERLLRFRGLQMGLGDVQRCRCDHPGRCIHLADEGNR